MATRNVVLTEQMEELVDRLVASGRYQNASETLRAGLRLLEKEEAEIVELRSRIGKSLREARAGEIAEGSGADAIDAVNDVTYHTLWKSSRHFPESVTVDLGQVQPDVGMLQVLPPYARTGPTNKANITSYGVLVSTDGSSFTEVASGTWAADAKMHTASFGPVAARYVRLEARDSSDRYTQLTDITIGAAQ